MAKTKKHQLAVTDKKTLHQNLSFVAKEQYKMLRTNLNFVLPDDLKCPIIGVTSSVRGEGKSTTAINLAYALAEDGKTVLLIDATFVSPVSQRSWDTRISRDLRISSRAAIPRCIRPIYTKTGTS